MKPTDVLPNADFSDLELRVLATTQPHLIGSQKFSDLASLPAARRVKLPRADDRPCDEPQAQTDESRPPPKKKQEPSKLFTALMGHSGITKREKFTSPFFDLSKYDL